MSDILYAPIYTSRLESEAGSYRAREHPGWTDTVVPKVKRVDQFGPPPRRSRVPNAAPTNRAMRATTKLEQALEKEAERNPDEAETIRQHLAILRATHEERMKAIREMRDGTTAQAR